MSHLSPDASRTAYEALRPALEALDPATLAPIRLPMAEVVDLVRRFAPCVKTLEPRLDAVYRNWEPGVAERLTQYDVRAAMDRPGEGLRLAQRGR